MTYWRSQEEGGGGAQKVVVSGKENHTRLEGLKPNSNYLIEVRGYNSAGYGPASEHLHIHTKKPRMSCLKRPPESVLEKHSPHLHLCFLCLSSAPSRPPKIIGKKLKGNSVNIAWENVEPLDNEAPIDGYKVSGFKTEIINVTFSSAFVDSPYVYMCTCVGAVQAAGPNRRHAVHHQQEVHRSSSAARWELYCGGASAHRRRRRSCGTNPHHR